MTIRAVLEPHVAGRGKRATARHALRLTADYQQTGGQAGAVLVHDLSAEGMLIESPQSLAIGSTLAVELPRSGSHDAEVVWSSGRFYGCRFARPLPSGALSAALLKALPAPGTSPRADSRDLPSPDRIAALRQSRGWSMEDVAERLGVSRQSVWYWESGKRHPKRPMVSLIAALYGVGERDLLAGEPAGPVAANDLHDWKRQIAERFGVASDKVKILVEL
jgi:transcriptional regulator with XRE-family HTH domain